METFGTKIRTKKRKRGAEDPMDDLLDIAQQLNTAIARMDGPLLSDYFAHRTKRHAPHLSFVELRDRRVPENFFLDTSSWDLPRILDNLPSFLERFSPGVKKPPSLSSPPDDSGAPNTLIITAAGIRAANICRVLKGVHAEASSVAKLFAKHIKLKDAIQYVQQTRISVGVGTPSRIADLMDAQALSSSGLERIVIDASHIDLKKRGLLDMRETHQPLISLLTRADLQSRYSDSGRSLKIVCF